VGESGGDPATCRASVGIERKPLGAFEHESKSEDPRDRSTAEQKQAVEAWRTRRCATDEAARA